MSDLISRQDAILAIEDMPNAYNGWSDTYDKACIIGVLEELPSAEPKTGWIPVSERLPNVGEDVLFCVADMYVSEGCRRDDGDWWQFRWSSVQPRSVVTAWMPLPDVYREDGEACTE